MNESKERDAMLIMLAGLPGTGKSKLGRALAAALPGIILDKDPIRAALFPPAEIEYSTQQDDFCLAVMLDVAGYLLRKDRHKIVILDGRPFSRRYQRTEVINYAASQAIPLAIIECVCADEIARQRLEADAASATHPARNRDFALYQRMKAHYEPLDEPRLVVDTDQEFSLCLATALEYLHKRLAENATTPGQSS